MRRTAAAANRTGLIIAGLIALLLGLAVLAIGFGFAASFVPTLTADGDLGSVATVLAMPFSALIALVVALILAIIGLRWLAAQVPRKDFAKPFRMQADARTGLTTVNAEVIAEAVTEDLESTDGVVDAQVILRGTARSPELLIHIDADERADIDAVIAEAADRVTGNASLALDAPLRAVALEVGIARTRSRRQRTVNLQ
ncbi:alkaline shock response membrane anchor protein AmaP [Brevibacterium spongiae]|uniref:Alkaline shock response membrane anchor protein AmaP n=1 Tax=Brevibacterium spongiae TaxID=2909672 RepID=A0ABY5SRK6_9MICO|nr:alkaline shock response membrane anchor protein AmaP [Brevibacterium spongiae]UVI35808.1 alkaline shock response membrane anchor protein AmaP [Brevibacterium spongiae]